MNTWVRNLWLLVAVGISGFWLFGCSGGGSSGSGFDAGGTNRIVSGTVTSQDPDVEPNTPLPDILVTISAEIDGQRYQSQELTDSNGFFEFRVRVPENLENVQLNFEGSIGDNLVAGEVAIPIATESNGIGVTAIWTIDTGVVVGDIDLFDIEDENDSSSSATTNSSASSAPSSQSNSNESNNDTSSSSSAPPSSAPSNLSDSSSSSSPATSSSESTSSGFGVGGSGSSVGTSSSGSIESPPESDSSSSSSSQSFAPPSSSSSSSSSSASSDEPVCGPTENVHGNGNSGQSEEHAIEKATEEAEDKVVDECGSLGSAEIFSATVTESTFDGSRWHATVEIEFCCLN